MICLAFGGHRRIELQAALRFLQTSRRRLVDPALLGLTEPDARALADPLDLGDRLYDHLRLGRRDRLEQDLLAVLTMGLLEPAELFDVPLRGAFERIGELWHGADEGIYVEHRATVALLAVLDRLHALYEVPDDAPLLDADHNATHLKKRRDCPGCEIGKMETLAMTESYTGSRTRLYELIESVSTLCPEASVR